MVQLPTLVRVTLLSLLMVQSPEAVNVTGETEAVALTPKSGSPNVLSQGPTTVMVGFSFEMAKVRETRRAGFQLTSPA